VDRWDCATLKRRAIYILILESSKLCKILQSISLHSLSMPRVQAVQRILAMSNLKFLISSTHISIVCLSGSYVDTAGPRDDSYVRVSSGHEASLTAVYIRFQIFFTQHLNPVARVYWEIEACRISATFIARRCYSCVQYQRDNIHIHLNHLSLTHETPRCG
jgi:hypothetical protein